METLGQRIRERRKFLKWSTTKLGMLAGVTPGYLSLIETDKKKPTLDTLQRIADMLGVPVSALYESKGNLGTERIPLRRVPVLEYGQLSHWKHLLTGNFPASGEMMMVSLEQSPTTFGVRHAGSSMEPHFREGDLLEVDPELSPAPGSLVMATDALGEAYFRQYREVGANRKNEKVFELVPMNGFYPTLNSDREKLEIVGVVVGFSRKLIAPHLNS